MSEISELFARDPLKLTRPDREQIVQYYRDNRAKYFLGTPKEPKPPKLTAEERKAQKALESPKEKIKLELGDLDL